MISALLISLVASVALPQGPAPEALNFAHFPDRLHAFVWRNWTLVPLDRMAEVVGATEEDLLTVGTSMGLPVPPNIPESQLQRTYITIIRANWHLLNYDQLLVLLGWDAAHLAYTLQEDDFLFIKLGSLKPACPPLAWAPPSEAAQARAAQIAAQVKGLFGDTAGVTPDPPLSFVEHLSAPVNGGSEETGESLFHPRFCYSYFALYGDPLIEQDPFPENYLKRLHASGVDGVWLQGVLYTLAPFPWQPDLSVKWEQRLERLCELTERAAAQGMGIYMYLNEPRTMPLSFFEQHPELRGVTEGDHAALCTSVPQVRDYIRESVARICAAAPKLAGFFTITASENLTNCWSHHRGNECPRCGTRNPGEVIAEVNASIQAGIDQAGSAARLIAWDWGWNDTWAPDAIAALPAKVSHMSVSEWSLPINRGGIESTVGEYSISAIGPGPRAQRHWKLARERGLNTLAKIQANNTWELSSVPYIPAVANVAKHVAALRDTGVTGLMLGWTLGGHPSPNLEVVYELGKKRGDGTYPSAEEAMEIVATRRFGPAAQEVVGAWTEISTAFSEFPYNGGLVYCAPLQMGPANLLWAAATGYRATMVGIPYDDLDSWRVIYPPEVFIAQLDKVAAGFDAGVRRMQDAAESLAEPEFKQAVLKEHDVTLAAYVHFKSVSNQALFVLRRNRLNTDGLSETDANALKEGIMEMLRAEKRLAEEMYHLRAKDSRLGFEATNQYFYMPLDLIEKTINCEWLLACDWPQKSQQ